MNGLIIDGKVYEAVPSVGYCNCDGCDLSEVCDAHAHDICNDCSKFFDTYIDDPCWHFRFSKELTDKIKKDMINLEEKAFDFRNQCQPVLTSEGNLYSESALLSAYLAGAKEALASQWRNVREELPEFDDTVIVNCINGVYLGSYDNDENKWYIHTEDYGMGNVVYWMPLPKLPTM